MLCPGFSSGLFQKLRFGVFEKGLKMTTAGMGLWLLVAVLGAAWLIFTA